MEVPKAVPNEEPWVSLGISRRTYFRRKESAILGEVSAKDGGTAPKCAKHPQEKNDITRAQMKAIIDAGQSFVPNWYESGHGCREDGIQYALKMVRGL